MSASADRITAWDRILIVRRSLGSIGRRCDHLTMQESADLLRRRAPVGASRTVCVEKMTLADRQCERDTDPQRESYPVVVPERRQARIALAMADQPLLPA